MLNPKYATTKLQQKLSITGDTMCGTLNMGNNGIAGILNSVSAQNVTTKIYANPLGTTKLTKSEIL